MDRWDQFLNIVVLLEYFNDKSSGLNWLTSRIGASRAAIFRFTNLRASKRCTLGDTHVIKGENALLDELCLKLDNK